MNAILMFSRRLTKFRAGGILKKPTLHALAALALCFAFQCSLSAQEAPANDHPVAPAWKLADLDGKPISLADFKGKVVILDFWATWCAPCRDEIPGFVELQKKFADQGLVVIGISLDQEGAAFVQRFVKQHGVTYPVVLGDPEVAAAYDGIDALPTTFIIDRAGKVVKGHRGFTEQAKFEADITPLL